MPTNEPTAERTRPEAGDTIELTLDRLGHGGEAVGRADGFVHFVPYGAPGDRVRVNVREVKRSFARSQITEILDPSPHRVDPRCPYFAKCGGCHLQHLSDEGQLLARRGVVVDALQRLGGIQTPDVTEAVSGDTRWSYRRRIELHLRTQENGSIKVGFVHHGGKKLVAIEQCLIAFEGFEPVLAALVPAAADSEEPLNGRIELRTGHPPGDVHIHLGPGTEAFASPLLRRLQSTTEIGHITIFWREGSVRKCAPRANPAPLRLETPWATWNVPPSAFYQVNPPLAIRAAEQVAAWTDLGPEDHGIELYAGMGFFAAAFAREAKRVWCLEGHFTAVRAGEATMRRAGIENVRFVPGPVEMRLPTMSVKGKLAAAVLDPPREGVPKSVLDALVALDPARIVYISCEPSTLARDVKRLIGAGYAHRQTVPYDFFPQTYHVESVTLLERS